MKTISLDSKFRGVNSNCFTGRKEGQEARKELRLDEKDRDSETYSIMIPTSTTSFNASFYLGLLFTSISNLGSMEAFDKKYVINYDKLENGLRPIIQANIEECRRKAANEIAGTTGLDF